MVRDVAPAFVEEIIVDRSFFVDWHQLPQLALAEFKTLGRNRHYRTTIHFEDIVHRVEFGTIGAGGDRDLGEKTILLLISGAYSLQGARNAAGDDRIAGMQLGDLPDLVDGIACVPFQFDLSDDGTRAGYDMEGHVDLVLRLIAIFGDRHSRLVESIFFHYALNARQSAVDFLARVKFAEL